MPNYTFIPQVEDALPAKADQFSLFLPSDEHACDNARDWLNTSDVTRATIRIGRHTLQNFRWLGAYDYEQGREPIWLAQR
jgi:hypothetical protein